MSAAHGSAVREALAEIRRLKAEVAALRAEHHPTGSAIAIVGMACRFPGAPDLAAYWDLLLNGREGVGPVPASRWNPETIALDVEAARSALRQGGFIDDVDAFDAAFFGISPREALLMDPQHRLVLELGWTALEDAAIDPTSLADSSTGVFLGISANDYTANVVATAGLLDGHQLSGGGFSFAPGRLARHLGLRGPTLALDSACSSSLVAVHLACRAILAGECRLAIAGGVNVIATPAGGVLAARAGMLSPTGRCHSFAAAADGFVRAEGCGLVVLKSVDDATRNGDRIVAVIRGSAVGHDGPSSGLTVPNPVAQAAVIRQALTAAALEPDGVAYVETHGTGTRLGDPIEVQGLRSVFGQARQSDRLRLGAVKSAIGHAESAAGVAGLIKAALSLCHGVVPPDPPRGATNPLIPWGEMPFDLADAAAPLASQSAVGVSSFGASGTNAHVVLGATPAATTSGDASPRPLHLLALSARSPDGLEQLLQRHAQRLADDTVAVADYVATATIGRAHLTHRLAVVGRDATRLRQALLTRRHEAAATRRSQPPRIAFLFTGQGVRQLGAGGELYATDAGFRADIDRHQAMLAGVSSDFANAALPVLLFTADGAARLRRQTELAQPALLALGLSLAALWRRCGIVPTLVAGHSLGELTAAVEAGVFAPEDALRLAVTRGRLMAATEPGGMLALPIGEDAARTLLAEAPELALAAINGPASVVVAGAAAPLAAFADACAGRGIDTFAIAAPRAFHAPPMDCALDAWEAAVAATPRRVPQRRLASNVTGRLETAALTEPGYWRRQMREPVQFHRAASALVEAGADTVVELGPHPVLLALANRALPDAPVVWAESLREGRSDQATFLGSLGRLYEAGATVDWRGLQNGAPWRRVDLPTYPFARTRFWIDRPLASEPMPPPRIEPPPAATLRGCIAAVLGITEDTLPLEVPLRELGLDSVLALELQARLAAVTATPPDLATLLAGASVADLEAPSRRNAATGQWLARLGDSTPIPQGRVIYLPYAGAGPSTARVWREALPPTLELYGATLPAREGRLAEPAVSNMDALADALAAAVLPLSDRPLCLVGHSFGATLAFAVAERLARAGVSACSLVLVAYTPPHLPSPLHAQTSRLAALPEDVDPAILRDSLSGFEGVAIDPAVLKLAWPGLRADFVALAGCGVRRAPALPFPLTAVAGDSDADFPPLLLQQWQDCTSAAFTLLRVPGDHLTAARPGGALLDAVLMAAGSTPTAASRARSAHG
jgi:acyl transferase domain-containing protein/surfactin synthase thioesterase subunit